MSIENLTARFVQALDKDYDVVNMEAVLSVIGALENATITKEQLESTRLAKYINLFRRRTRSESLAKRAKSLLKKWREMVGIQQNVNETSRIDNPSQPTLPLGINTSECGPLRSNDTSYQNNIVLLTSTNRNANLLNQHVDKRLETHGSDGRVPNMPVSTAFGKTQPQPTSFANLITGFSTASSEKNNTMPSATQNTINVPNTRRKIRSSIRCTNLSAFPDGISADQASNSNSAINYASYSNQSKLSGITEPIVIDIDDSNSNLIGNDVKAKEADVVIISTSTGNKAIKHKKGKKEKKRTKERETSNEAVAPLVVIDAESSQSQQPQWRNIVNLIDVEKCTPVQIDDKSRNSIQISTKMSEILSLSNSSISSVFPISTVGDTKNDFLRHNNNPLLESELSFAGKFTPQNTDNLKSQQQSDTTSCENVCNIFQKNCNNEGSAKAETMGTVANKIHLFNESGHNSIDSASNSRHSNFEVVDSISQGLHLQKSHIPTSTEATLIPEQKVPKKRGRKKGSKGIDSLIAKDTSLSSQMLMQSLNSGSKKVKTTKELYAEMQNRKLGVSTPTTPSHWVGAQNQSSVVRRDSFCSEPSLHSPRTFDACSTNATISTAATGSTPEKSGLQRRTAEIDSESDSLISGGLSHGSVTPFIPTENVENKQESNSRLQQQSTSSATFKRDVEANVLTAIETKLRNIIQKMPAVPSRLKIEKEIAIDVVPCTCKVMEILPEQKIFDTDISTMSNLLSLDALKSTNNSGDEFEKPVITINVTESNNITDFKPTKINTLLDKIKEPKEKHLEKPKKSIFDLDFDEGEDPLNTLLAEVAAASDIAKNEKTDEKDISPSTDVSLDNQTQICEEGQGPNPISEQAHLDNSQFTSIPIAPVTIFPTYKIEEDEMCLAKKRFELQTQKITNFHINALHNFYIPNVNGNWDNSFLCTRETKKKDMELINDVVPKISNLWGTDEQIKKDLMNMNFDPTFKPRQISTTVEQLVYEKPFLGVARGLKGAHRKTRKHRLPSKQNGTNDRKEIDDKSIDQKEDSNHKFELLHDSADIVNKEIVKSSCDGLKEATQNLYLDDITIDIIPELKSDVIADTQTLLTIASNVNFNNNQIGDHTISRVNMNIEESCTRKLEDAVVAGNVNEKRVAFCSNGGDIQNNNVINKCNNADKLEESSCESHSSLKQTQKSINLKLRKHRRQYIIEKEQNSPKSYSKRKRRRKEMQTIKKNPKVKCIKIAINGGITTQRHITFRNSSEDDDDEGDVDEDSNASASDDRFTEPDQRTNDVGTGYFGESDEESNVHASEDDWEQEEQANDVAVTGLHNAEIDDYYCEDEDDDDYEEEDDEYFGEFHEVVTRDISPFTESGNNHIVLTIKKTPSKTNSPSNSLSAMSPLISLNKKISSKVTNNAELGKEKEDESKTEVFEKPVSNTDSDVMETENNPRNTNISTKLPTNIHLECLTRYNCVPNDLKRKRQYRRRKIFKLPQFRFPDESSEGERVFKKLHQKLFFPHEIFAQTNEGYKQRIFDNSSCNSSCAEESEYEYENSTSDTDSLNKNICALETDLVETLNDTQNTVHTIKEDNNESDNSLSNSNDSLTEISNTLHKIYSTEKFEIQSVGNNLPDDNNGNLVSFNNICILHNPITEFSTATPTASLPATTENTFDNLSQFQQDKNTLKFNPAKYNNLNSTDSMNLQECSHYKEVKNDICFKPNTFNSIKNSKDYFMPRPEYCTGLRTLDTTTTDKVEVISDQIENFKEWHQILHLRSYNDELLTVLPYVVLD